MSKVIKKKAVYKKKKKPAGTKKFNVLKSIDAVTININTSDSVVPLTTRGITSYRAAIHPSNGFGEIEVKDTTGAVTKIFSATNPALYAALLLMLNNPTKAITQGGYIYVTA